MKRREGGRGKCVSVFNKNPALSPPAVSVRLYRPAQHAWYTVTTPPRFFFKPIKTSKKNNNNKTQKNTHTHTSTPHTDWRGGWVGGGVVVHVSRAPFSAAPQVCFEVVDHHHTHPQMRTHATPPTIIIRGDGIGPFCIDFITRRGKKTVTSQAKHKDKTDGGHFVGGCWPGQGVVLGGV